MASRTPDQAWSKGLDAGTHCKQYQANCKLPMQPIFKEKSNYPDFLHIRMFRRPNLSG
jgi:hypothetical protein